MKQKQLNCDECVKVFSLPDKRLRSFIAHKLGYHNTNVKMLNRQQFVFLCI